MLLLFFRNFSCLILFPLLWNIHCISVLPLKHGSLESLKANEQALIDFYGNKEKSQNALDRLKRRCHSYSREEALSCYNHSVLLFYSDQKEEALDSAKRAFLKSPEDQLYRDLFRQIAEDLGKENEIMDVLKEKKESIYKLSKLFRQCRAKDVDVAEITLQELIRDGEINVELLNKGPIASCFSKEKISAYKQMAQKSKISYQKAFLEEKKKSHPYGSIWDPGYLILKKPFEKYEVSERPITKHWKDFRNALSSGNSANAETSFKSYAQELKKGLQNDKKNKIYYQALHRATILLLEQDKFYALAKGFVPELSDKEK